MSKQRRMGRNLDALLGGSSRSRASLSAKAEVPAAEEAHKVGVPPDANKQQHGHKESSAEQSTNSTTTAFRPDSLKADEASDRPQLSEAGVEPVQDQASADPTVESPQGERLQWLAIEQIRRGSFQPRRLFDQTLLQELADSIKAQGMIQPIIVRPFAGAYELVAGERRWRAAQLAGLSEVPALIRLMPDKSVAAVALIENIQRKDLNPLEEAAALERLCDEFGMTHKTVAQSVGRSRAAVTNLLRLLELHDEVKVLVDKGELEMGHARALLAAPTEQQHGIALQIIQQNLTVRAVEKLVKGLNQVSPKSDTPKTPDVDPDIHRLSQKLGETLGAKVKIQHRDSGSGKLEISYSSVSELQGILAHIK